MTLRNGRECLNFLEQILALHLSFKHPNIKHLSTSGIHKHNFVTW